MWQNKRSRSQNARINFLANNTSNSVDNRQAPMCWRLPNIWDSLSCLSVAQGRVVQGQALRVLSFAPHLLKTDFALVWSWDFILWVLPEDLQAPQRGVSPPSAAWNKAHSVGVSDNRRVKWKLVCACRGTPRSALKNMRPWRMEGDVGGITCIPNTSAGVWQVMREINGSLLLSEQVTEVHRDWRRDSKSRTSFTSKLEMKPGTENRL